MEDKLYQCPCCDYFTLDMPNSYDICHICFWEDDGVNIHQLDEESGPNHITLRQGRENFKKFGACDLDCIQHVLPESEREKFIYRPRLI